MEVGGGCFCAGPLFLISFPRCMQARVWSAYPTPSQTPYLLTNSTSACAIQWQSITPAGQLLASPCVSAVGQLPQPSSRAPLLPLPSLLAAAATHHSPRDQCSCRFCGCAWLHPRPLDRQCCPRPCTHSTKDLCPRIRPHDCCTPQQRIAQAPPPYPLPSQPLAACLRCVAAPLSFHGPRQTTHTPSSPLVASTLPPRRPLCACLFHAQQHRPRLQQPPTSRVPSPT
mmetsp:Transcript_9583/g.25895  ORF Transcript_9583/g.25895 Transcript_9583/m.25895 type:complete len:227 (+) Transcript_9583:2256-2936(+)